jgi:hypothetical protein
LRVVFKDCQVKTLSNELFARPTASSVTWLGARVAAQAQRMIRYVWFGGVRSGDFHLKKLVFGFASLGQLGVAILARTLLHLGAFAEVWNLNANPNANLVV